MLRPLAYLSAMRLSFVTFYPYLYHQPTFAAYLDIK